MLLLLLFLLIPCNASQLIASSQSNTSLRPTAPINQSTQTDSIDSLSTQHATTAAQILHQFAQLHLSSQTQIRPTSQQQIQPQLQRPTEHSSQSVQKNAFYDPIITDGIYGAGL